MKSVLISIQPKWCEPICNLIKTVEVRKNKPKLDTPFKCYIYCTKGRDMLYSVNGIAQPITTINLDLKQDNTIQTLNGKVIGEFVCDRIDIISNKDLQENFRRLSHIIVKSCLKVQELKDYLGYKNGYGWHISNLKIYDKPKELSEFEKNKAPQSWYYVEEVKQCKKN